MCESLVGLEFDSCGFMFISMCLLMCVLRLLGLNICFCFGGEGVDVDNDVANIVHGCNYLVVFETCALFEVSLLLEKVR